MSDGFAPVAGKLAGLAGRVLGWRPNEFWQATPAELAAILFCGAGDGAAAGLTRTDLTRLMEQDHD